MPIKLVCPNDTNGDGDCGKPLCPYCGEFAKRRDWHTELTNILDGQGIRQDGLAAEIIDGLGLDDWTGQWQPNHPAVAQVREYRKTVEEQARLIDNLKASLDEQRRQLRDLLHPTSGQLNVVMDQSVHIVGQAAT